MPEQPKPQIKSKARVAARGEVFTAQREVNAMLDLVKPETERISSRFLEPACGDGNFLAEILRRKLAAAQREARPPRRKTVNTEAYTKNAILAAGSIYGVDIMQDNVLACRARMFALWDEAYTALCKSAALPGVRRFVQMIFARNIVCGDALTMRCVDAAGQDTGEPIIFSEWTFPTAYRLLRTDCRFDRMLTPAPPPRDLFAGSGAAGPAPQQLAMPGLAPEPVPNPPPQEGEVVGSRLYTYKEVCDYAGPDD